MNPGATDTRSSAQAPTLWAIVGATGTGKSELSLDLAQALAASGRRAEIVNADAMQFYRGMDIGTAKLPFSERRGIPHHLFDVLSPATEATVAWYQPAARSVIAEILGRGDDAILVGGSGLYVSSVIFDFQFPPRDAALRAQLEADAAATGVPALVARLAELAPAVAASVDTQNPRRVIRALEVALLGGDAQTTLPSDPVRWHEATRILGVHSERAELVARLDRRVERMWEAGLLDEVRALIPEGVREGPTASRAIGYAQALAQLDGRLSEAEAIAETQALTRRYARRQVSWFRRYPGVEWRGPGELPAT
ncbi:tRNA (adenosine(37)-N6)-dimethylallyltransferase MiaA [Leucobacter chromiireducens]|uniref:tRNA dimethylallyltransferase n=1 Tax=Leucobacter chromiireducens subsp. solipictus TaxID=398235 RepID=A0ABS1SCV5_9MICO|nr:tRNA (adenosine(37)-N6)-dimethylallyltransferase MiaA [Leucobacter chromiireducens]MBL3678172.1 tRNA (adenosine(37)-N6)-dimethylallyltransferase MiaA [Leucobacter chromiireducens subsp. solipictus]